MGQVWRARDTMLHRDVAVKILRPELARQKGFLARFRSEARSAARLSHPNVAQLYDYGEIHDDGPDQSPTSAYLVMELVPAEPLSATLAEEGRLEPERVIDLLGQIGWGLGAAHAAGVVHRDIKPGNVLVTTEGLVKITDFGVALAKGDVALTDTGQVMGTAQYLSPEQALGEQVTPASDVYSLGVVAYECLAGRLPFPRENAVATALAHVHDDAPPLPPDVPPALSDLVSAMLRKTPQERPGTGREVAVAANAVQSGFRANLPAAEVATLPETTRQDAQSGDESLPGVQDSATERVTFGPLARNGPAQAGQAAEQDPSSTDSAAPASRTTGPTA
ncbi:MAG: serine/threonine protein kinase, partial [Micrococcales bacterium]